MGKFLAKQALVPDLKAHECVALEYYKDSIGAALPLKCLKVQKPPDKVKSFVLRLPLQLPAELAAFLNKHPAWGELLKKDMKANGVELDTSAGANLRTRVALFIAHMYSHHDRVLVMVVQ